MEEHARAGDVERRRDDDDARPVVAARASRATARASPRVLNGFGSKQITRAAADVPRPAERSGPCASAGPSRRARDREHGRDAAPDQRERRVETVVRWSPESTTTASACAGDPPARGQTNSTAQSDEPGAHEHGQHEESAADHRDE